MSSLPAAVRELPLMPMPAHVELREGELPITVDFQVGLCGARDVRAKQALRRFAENVQRRSGVFLPRPVMADGCAGATLAVEVGRRTSAPEFRVDESYRLEVTPSAAKLRAETTEGALRGLATFEQLVSASAKAMCVPAMVVEDRPRFPWRGLSLDVARHWMPVEVVKRNLDGLAAVKLNVFHWHLADDQGFRVESFRLPKLHERGSDGHYYTQAQIREVVSYAADRGIRVVPEFDVPGHATSWLVGYPELGSGPAPTGIERNWGVFHSTFDPTNEETYRFLDAFVGEMAGLFPDPYFHIGGDEIDDHDWKANARIQEFMRAHQIASTVRLHEYFNGRLREILSKHGKKMVGWDEILTPDLPKDAVIQSWRGQEALAKAAQDGYQGLLSFGYYLDHMRPASYHYANDPLGGAAKSLAPEAAAHVLGGEACMWTEYTSPETVDSRIWPRLAVVAERLWSPATVVDEASMYARLEIVSRQLQWVGLEHLSVQQRVVDRMVGGDREKEPALAVLVNSVEAAGIHDRYPSHHYTSLEPLNRLVDAARAESEWIRSLTADAQTVAGPAAGDPAAVVRLREAFRKWRQLPTVFAESGPEQETFLLREVKPVADILGRVGEIGEQTLQYAERREQPPAEWVAQQKSALKKSDALTAEVRVSAGRVVLALLKGWDQGSEAQHAAMH